jgi:hypothetical protein
LQGVESLLEYIDHRIEVAIAFLNSLPLVVHPLVIIRSSQQKEGGFAQIGKNPPNTHLIKGD